MREAPEAAGAVRVIAQKEKRSDIAKTLKKPAPKVTQIGKSGVNETGVSPF